MLFAWLVRIDAAVDEAMQAMALIGLGIAALLAAWSLTSAAGRGSPHIGAILLGLAGSIATNLYLIVMLYYYGGQFALPFIPA